MADPVPGVTPAGADLSFASERVAAFLKTLEVMASGAVDVRLPISPRHDALDAIAFGINVLVGELSWAGELAKKAQEERAEALQAAVANAEARNSALLHAIPDLMFLLHRDGTYLDYHARDPKSLFAPPEAFLGRNVRDILPPALAAVIVDALERACQGDDPVVVVEYELPMPEPRAYETRIVQAGTDRLLSIVRDVTDNKRASERIRDLAQRLIASQEMERQRIARELHDDISQQMALLNVHIDELTEQTGSDLSRARLRALSAQASEIARALHDLSHELHPSKLRALGLVAAVRSLCHDAEQRHLHVAFAHGTLPSPVDANVSLGLYRIVQEALHNVARHSLTTEAQVTLTSDASDIVLDITDAGVGFDPKRIANSGLGLVSMQERVAILKGQMAIEAAPGAGTRIHVRIPVT
jgi:signal transduction histidine kinase